MTINEIGNNLLEKTKDLPIQELVPAKSMEDLFRLLMLAQLTKENIETLEFYKTEETFEKVFYDYDLKKILKGRYVDLLERVLSTFQPEKTACYKKIAKAGYQASKYLIRFSSLEDYKKQLIIKCLDDEKTLAFLLDFRFEASLAEMYFHKTCSFFQNSGLLDVPIVDKKSKDYLLPLLQIADDNVLLYKQMLSLSRFLSISCYELNQRIHVLTTC